MQHGQAILQRAIHQRLRDGAADEFRVLGFALDDDAESDDGVEIPALGKLLHHERNLEGTGHRMAINLRAGHDLAQLFLVVLHQSLHEFVVILAGDDCHGAAVQNLARTIWKNAGHWTANKPGMLHKRKRGDKARGLLFFASRRKGVTLRAVDSFTHIVVGATLGQLFAGRVLGRKALLWGAALGSLPDADVLPMKWLDEAQRLEWHRGFMHSLLFMVLAAPLLGWLIAKIHRGKITFQRAALFALAAIFSHLLLDCCTVYGTEIFQPFRADRVAWNLLFIIDPLFTLPFTLATLGLLWKGNENVRQWIGVVATVLGVAYLAWSLSAKLAVDRAFEKAFAAQHLQVQRYMTAPTPLNTILWRAVAEGPNGYWIGYHSLFDGARPIRFRYVERGEESLGALADSSAAQTVRWFSNGYWIARDVGDGSVRMADLRFGETNIATLHRDPDAFFAWRIVPSANGGSLESAGTPRGPIRPLLGALRRRILGETSPLWPL